jgi:phage terminase large subunit-like protein
MDINEAYYRMGQLGETSLRSILNHHGIKATGTFKNCICCMKWKGGNKTVSKVDANPPQYPGERLHLMLVDHYHYHKEDKILVKD